MYNEDNINAGDVVELRYLPLPITNSGTCNADILLEKDCGHVLSVIQGGAEGEVAVVQCMTVRPVLDWEHRNYDENELDVPIGTILLKRLPAVVNRILGIPWETQMFLDHANNRLVLVDQALEASIMYRVEDGICEVVGNEEPVLCSQVDQTVQFLLGEVNALRWALTNSK